jgi:hypothetical protein
MREWGIAEYLLDQLERMLVFLIHCECTASDLLHTFPSLPNVTCTFQKGGNNVQQDDNVRIVCNEFPIITGEAQQTIGALTVFRLRPIHNCMGCMFLGVDAILANVKAT